MIARSFLFHKYFLKIKNKVEEQSDLASDNSRILILHMTTILVGLSP
jgi:hypothetical protein